VSVGIKWPNDLQLGERKLGGILCESAHGAVVAGIGLNIRFPPEGLPEEISAHATALESAGSGRVSPGELATRLLHELHVLLPRGASMHPDLHKELEKRDVLLGRPIWTQQAGNGTARGIDPDGALVLERADGERVRVVAGSVRSL